MSRHSRLVFAGLVLATTACKSHPSDKPLPGPANLPREIAEKTAAYYKKHGRLPPSGTATPGRGSCCDVAGQKCEEDPEAWTRPPWSDIGFKIKGETYFRVSLETSSAGFTARANGDLDCDGTFSTFEVFGDIDKDTGKLRAFGKYSSNELE